MPTSKARAPQVLLQRPADHRRGRTFQYIRVEENSAVGKIVLDHPEHNLLNEALLLELADAMEMLSEAQELKVILLEAAGKVFCGGMDIGEYTTERAFPVLDAFQLACTAMMEAARPVVVVVDGPAIGAGAELAAFGDLLIATPRARFALPEITIGMFPPLASTILPMLIGPKLALELVLTGEAITAERARELGLVNRLVPEAQLRQAVDELVARITAQSGAVLAMAKRAVIGGLGLSLRDALRVSRDIFLNELAPLEDSREGLRALAERRKPHWKNR